jgi:hypothetical protein
MTDTQANDRAMARNRIRFLDLAMDGIVREALRAKKDQQLDHLRQTLPELCAATHYIDGSSEIDSLIEAWNAAEQIDRMTPPGAVQIDVSSDFSTNKIIDRVLQRSIGSVRSLPLHRAHKPMFKPYPQEIDAALNASNSVQAAFTTLFDAMIA